MKEISPGEPVAFGETILTPVEERRIHCRAKDGVVWCYASKRPVAITITTPEGEVTLDIREQELTPDEQRER